ncbi:transmembrane channel-like protein [Cloeon dipterum]|uniref:transmembrane channel-like protein n=1 Tax=Cloeon dipterum TaxID=197152 RepID=UPI00321FBE29
MGVSALGRSPDRRGSSSTLGILRLDISKPRRSSGSSVEFRDLQVGPSSPQPSVDRLSVSFAVGGGIDDACDQRSDRSDTSIKGLRGLSPYDMATERVHFNKDRNEDDAGEEGCEDDDYSASMNAIIQRRNSSRRPSKRKSRRPSSPFPDGDSGQSRRRSSVFTTSSVETAVSGEDGSGTTQEQIFERLRLHKEVLQSARQQSWPMRRKMKLVRQAKGYIRRHEGALQERLAHSRNTRDLAARAQLLLLKFWQHLKRELANLLNYLVPWESRIKEIESHFGSAVASYFTFLRWLFWVNLIITILLTTFVAVPEVLAADKRDALDDRKTMLPEEKANATDLLVLWDFEGVLRYSPMFYGFYSNRPTQPSGYRLPFAYFMTSLAVYVYSFVATLRRMAKNSRMSKLSEKADECVFTWKLLTGWDYMIGNKETAHNRTASIVLGFKEALLEEREKVKDSRNWKLIAMRVMVNIFVMLLLGGSAYAVVEMVKRSEEAHEIDSWWRQNEVSVVLSLITYTFPALFELLGFLENYHPRKQLRLQLARIMVLNLMNLYALILALFGKIGKMTDELQILKLNSTVATFPTSMPTTLPVTFDASTVTSTMGLDTATFVFAATNFTALLSTISSCPTKLIKVPVACSTPTSGETSTSTPFSPRGGETTAAAVLQFSLPASVHETTTEEGREREDEDPQPFANYTDDDPNNYNYSAPPQTIARGTEYGPEEYEPDYSSNSSNYYDPFSSNVSTTTVSPIVATRAKVDVQSLLSGFFSSYLKALTTYKSIKSTTPAQEITVQNYDELEETSTVSMTTLQDEESSTWTTSESSFPSDMPDEQNYCFEWVCPFQEAETTTGDERDTTAATNTFELAQAENEPDLKGETPTTSTESDFGCEEYSTLTPGSDSRRPSDLQMRRDLRRLCWETMFGQELVKLTVMDLVMTVLTVLLIDFFRALFVRFMNNCWCWDLEKQFPQYGDFKIAENILQLVHNQGMVWMGMFFSPGLPALNIFKLVVIFYLRSWAVLTCNVPHEVLFRASRSNNFYLALLLTMLFLCVLPVSFAIVWLEPSWHCGPFSQYHRIFHILTESIRSATPNKLHLVLDYVASPGIVIPLLVLLVLIIYYLMSLTSALREANVDLKVQLRRERTEERRKMFQMVDRKGEGVAANGGNDALLSRWRKILPTIPKQGNPFVAAAAAAAAANKPEVKEQNLLNGGANKQSTPEKLSKLTEKQSKILRSARRAAAARTVSEDQDSHAEGTDAEQQDSLPDDSQAAAGGARAPLKHQSTIKSTASTTSSTNRAEIPVITISKTESQDRLLDAAAEPDKSVAPGEKSIKVDLNNEDIDTNDGSAN